MQKPVLFFPYHDPSGKYAETLLKSLNDLHEQFSGICIGVTAQTASAQSPVIDQLKMSGCHILMYKEESALGSHQRDGLAYANEELPDASTIYFGFIDRILFALKTEYREAFLSDIQKTYTEDLIIFSRTEKAWDSHPKAYRNIERAITDIGEVYINQRVDWTWCGAIIKKEIARLIVRQADAEDFSVLGQFILAAYSSGAKIQSVFADWLEWEDPFWDPGKTKDQPTSEKENDFRLTYSLGVAEMFLKIND